MRNVKYLNTPQRVDMDGPLNAGAKRKRVLAPYLPMDSVTAVMHALEEISDIVSAGCFTHPDNLTQDGITAYALALIRMRECAGMAGMERLMNACDALAVTVSRLIEDRACASHAKCEALTQFVAHARAMILTSASKTAEFVMPSLPTKTMWGDAVAR